MERYARLTYRVMPLAVIAVCAFFAAKALGHYVEAQISSSSRGAAARRFHVTPPPEAALGATARDITSVLDRNIFCSDCEKTGASQAVAPAAPADLDLPTVDGQTPVKSSLPLALIATLISVEEAGWNVALIGSTGTDTPQEPKIFGVGSTVPGDAVITEISERIVLLRNAGKLEYLDLMGSGASPGSGGGGPPSAGRHAPGLYLPKALEGMQPVADGITRTGGTKYTLRRSMVERVLANPKAFAKGSRLVPVVRNGKPAGFRFFGLRGGLGSLLGMFGGDLIKSVNGQRVTTPDQFLEVLQGMRNASQVRVTYERKGQTLHHDYNIQ